jgi:recombination protein RecT
MSDELLKKHENWTDEQFRAEYSDMWENMKAQDVFMRLPKEQQVAIRKSEIATWENSKNGLMKIKTYAENEEVVKRFVNLLGDADGRAYLESAVIAVASNQSLQQCTPRSIMIQAMRAASLKLSLDPALHQAHLVKYGDEATLIPDYHGLVQLTESTGYYEIPPNVFEVYAGEDVKIDRFSGKVDITGEAASSEIIGWCGYFRAKNGTERWLYWKNEDCDAHGKKYNPKGFASTKSAWATDREKMRRKTVLRQLVMRWGHFSPHTEQLFKQEDEFVEAETIDMPDDSNIVIPKKEQRSEGDMLSQMGFGG